MRQVAQIFMRGLQTPTLSSPGSLSLGLCSLRVSVFITVPRVEAGSSLGKNSGHLLSQIPEKNKGWTAVTAHRMPTRSLH